MLKHRLSIVLTCVVIPACAGGAGPNNGHGCPDGRVQG